MEKEIERLKELLPTINPASKDYARVLNNLRDLVWFSDVYLDGKAKLKYEPMIKADDLQMNDDEHTIEFKPIEPTPMAEPVSTPVVETSKYDYDTVRKECTDAMSKGINVKDIIAKYVNPGDAAKLTNINAEDYEAFINDIHAEVANA